MGQVIYKKGRLAAIDNPVAENHTKRHVMAWLAHSSKATLQAAATLIADTDYPLQQPTLASLRYRYAQHMLPTATFTKALASDEQLKTGQTTISRQQALVAG